VRAAAALQTGDELQEDAVDAVAQARVVPLHLPRVFLALVHQQRFDDVSGDGIGGNVEMTISERLEDAETLAPASAHQQPVLGFDETEDPGVACTTISISMEEIQPPKK